MERKKIEDKKEKKDDKREGHISKYLKKNGQLHGLFHFVTCTVNILVVCYIYENFKKKI